MQPIQKRRHFRLRTELDDVPPLPPDVQIGLYRIAQEALNNIDKHAQAHEVEVSAVNYPDRLELSIRDDGQGFDPNAVTASHLGLHVMQERAAAIGASLEVASAIGQGTHITVIWQRNIKDA